MATFSYPKERIKVLLLENIHPRAVELFQQEGYQIETMPGSLSEDELVEKLKDVSIIGIRSATKLTARVFEHAPRLLTVGAFCIGTNQIDLEAASRAGVAVFNAPYSNTRSVVELTLGEIIMLARRTFERSTDMHAGIWNKSATGSIEVRGKRLGIVGYGNIGAQLSVLAESMGMQVSFYDITDKLSLGNAVRCDHLDDLLAQSDIVSVHVDGRASNANLIGAKEIALMKDGALLVNNARGSIVDVDAVAAALQSGKLGGYAADVFPAEPENGQEFTSPLRGLKNVILTPHIGGSTQEAQRNIGEFVATKLIGFINTGNTVLSVNIPNLQLPELANAHRLIHIHQNVPGVLAKVNGIITSTKANIVGQFLSTNNTIGYVITDIEQQYSDAIKDQLASLPETIRIRLLY